MAWNRPSEVGRVAPRPPRGGIFPKVIIATMVLAIGAAVMWFLLPYLSDHGTKHPDEATGSKRNAKDAPSKAPKRSLDEATLLPAKRRAAQRIAKASKGFVPLNRERIKPASHTNDLSRATMRVAPTGTDQILVSIFSRERGDMPMPLPFFFIPDNERNRLAEILIAKNPVTEDDTEYEAQAKLALQDAKAAIRDYLKEGGTVEDFIRFYHDDLVRCYNLKHDAELEVAKMLNEKEDRQLVVEFIHKVNEKFEAEGISMLAIPYANYSEEEENANEGN